MMDDSNTISSFRLYVKSTATLVTFIGNIIFWGLLGDGLWRASTKNGLNSGDRDSRGNALTGRSQRSSRLGVAPRLESVLIQSHAIRG